MINLFEIARTGSGIDGLSRRMALDPDLTRRAVEALLPAFALALRHSLLDPTAFAALAQAIGSGRYAPLYEAPLSSSGGDGVVGMLFRDPEAPSKIAAQAAAATGIGAQVMVEILPLLAGMLVGGLSRYATLDGYSDLLLSWSSALAAASRGFESTARPRPAPSPPPAADPWSAWLALVDAYAGRDTLPEHPRTAPTALEAWTARFVPSPPPHQPATPVNPFEALSRMFETGREVQAPYVEALRRILDEGWRRAPKPP